MFTWNGWSHSDNIGTGSSWVQVDDNKNNYVDRLGIESHDNSLVVSSTSLPGMWTLLKVPSFSMSLAVINDLSLKAPRLESSITFGISVRLSVMSIETLWVMVMDSWQPCAVDPSANVQESTTEPFSSCLAMADCTSVVSAYIHMKTHMWKVNVAMQISVFVFV